MTTPRTSRQPPKLDFGGLGLPPAPNLDRPVAHEPSAGSVADELIGGRTVISVVVELSADQADALAAGADVQLTLRVS